MPGKLFGGLLFKNRLLIQRRWKRTVFTFILPLILGGLMLFSHKDKNNNDVFSDGKASVQIHDAEILNLVGSNLYLCPAFSNDEKFGTTNYTRKVGIIASPEVNEMFDDFFQESAWNEVFEDHFVLFDSEEEAVENFQESMRDIWKKDGHSNVKSLNPICAIVKFPEDLLQSANPQITIRTRPQSQNGKSREMNTHVRYMYQLSTTARNEYFDTKFSRIQWYTEKFVLYAKMRHCRELEAKNEYDTGICGTFKEKDPLRFINSSVALAAETLFPDFLGGMGVATLFRFVFHNVVDVIVSAPYVIGGSVFENLADAFVPFMTIFVFPLFFLFVFHLFKEQKNGLFELLTSSGCGYFAYHFSWLIAFSFIFIPLSCIIAYFWTATVLKNGSFTLVVVSILLFSISLYAMVSMLSELVGRYSFGSFICFILFVLLGLTSDFTSSSAPSFQNYALYLLSPVTFRTFATMLINLSRTGREINWDSLHHSTADLSIKLALIFFTVDAVLYLTLGKLFYSLRKGEWNLFGRKAKVLDNGGKMMGGCSDGDGLHVQGLAKVYKRFGKSFKALENVSFHVPRGSILAILGENGSGKSTLLNILSGHHTASEGNVSLQGMQSADCELSGDSAGVCAQTTVLWDDLTVYEHMQLFSSFKGLTGSEEDRFVDIERMLNAFSLSSKTRSYPPQLSGGEARKLAVANAFIGGSKVVILDEPSVHLDPFSREALWKVIAKLKEDKIIIFSTHYADEAEALGDAVAMLHRGELVCFGTTSVLKSTHDCGYTFTIEKRIGQEAMVLKQLKEGIPRIFVDLETNSKWVFKAPLLDTHRVTLALNDLRQLQQENKIGQFTVSPATLEDVFCKVFTQKEKPDASFNYADEAGCDPATTSLLGRGASDHYAHSWGIRSGLFGCFLQLYKRVLSWIRNYFYFIFEVLFPAALFCLLFLSMRLRMKTSAEKPLTLDLSLVNIKGNMQPLQLVPLWTLGSTNSSYITDVFEAGIPQYWEKLNITSTPSKSTLMSRSLFGSNGNIMEKFFEEQMGIITKAVDGFKTQVDLSGAYYGQSLASIAPAMSSYANLDRMDSFVLRAILELFDAKINGILYNRDFLHSYPVYLNMLMNLQAKQYGFDYQVSIVNHPLHSASSQIELPLFFAFGLALALLPMIFVYWSAFERIMFLKHRQCASGLAITAYWISNILFDAFLTGCCCLVMLGVSSGFNSMEWEKPELGKDLINLIGLYLLAAVPHAYLVAALPAKDYVSPAVSLAGSNVAAMVIAILSYAFYDVAHYKKDGSLESLKIVSIVLNTMGLALPAYNLNFLMVAAYVKHRDSEQLLSYDDVHFYPVWYFLLGNVICYWSLFILVELFQLYGSRIISLFGSSNSGAAAEPPSFCKPVVSTPRDGLKVNHLQKIYRKLKNYLFNRSNRFVALQEVTFSSGYGQFISLIGDNGAGKSTLMNILSGILHKTSGNVMLGNATMEKTPLSFIRSTAFAPQDVGLWDDFTVMDHLKLFARLCGMRSPNLNTILMNYLKQFRMEMYAHSKVKQLSGGTQRKLSVLLTLFGKKGLLMLDEPAAGLDPLSRRRLVRFLGSWSRSFNCPPVILISTHSFEEVEDISDTMLLLNKGKMLYYGSVMSLKANHKNSAELKLRFSITTSEEVMEVMESFGVGASDRFHYSDALDKLKSSDFCKFLFHGEELSEAFASQWSHGSEMKMEHIPVQDFAFWWVNMAKAGTVAQLLASHGITMHLVKSNGSVFYFLLTSEEDSFIPLALDLLGNSRKMQSLGVSLIEVAVGSLPLIRMIAALKKRYAL